MEVKDYSKKEKTYMCTYCQRVESSRKEISPAEKVKQLIQCFRKYVDKGCSYVCSVCQQINFIKYVVKVSSLKVSIQCELLQ